MFEDLRLAWRSLRRAPGFAITTVLALGVAIGANTAILSVADGVLFRPLPWTDPARLHILQMLDRETGRPYSLVSYAHLRRLNESRQGFSPAAMFADGPRLLAETADGAEAVPTLAVSADYFAIVGVRPALGRLFTEADAIAAGRAAVLSFESWRQRFGEDRGVVGRTEVVGNRTLQILGVLPAGFVFPASAGLIGRPEIITLLPPVPPGAPGGVLQPVVRLDPGVSRDRAQAAIDALFAPDAGRDASPVEPTPVLADIRATIYPVGQPIMKFLLAAALLVLLVGCANVAILLLTRARRRERETAIQAALGARRARLLRPLVMEALLIAAASAALAMVVTRALFDLLLRQVPPQAYGNAPVGVDLRVAAISLGLAAAGALAFALVPAWRSSRTDLLPLIRGRVTARRGGRIGLGAPMVTVQVALASALVVGAAAATRTFLNVLQVPVGFDPDGVLTVSVVPPEGPGLDRQRWYAQAVALVAGRPGVIAAGAAGSIPFDGSAPDEGVMLPGTRTPVAAIVHVLPGYAETVGMPVLSGRALVWSDLETGADAVLASEAAVRALFPDGDVIGRAFDNGRGRVGRVVGIVGNVRRNLGRNEPPIIYALPGPATRSMTIVARLPARREAALADLRRDVARLAPGRPVRATWWSDTIGAIAAYRTPRFQTIVLGGFSVVALGLTALGVFAVVAFVVGSRTREIGVRLAVGATPRSIVRLMVRQALAPVGLGLLLGLLAARGVAGLAESQLHQVETGDPLMLVAAAVTVFASAGLAAWWPARRAGRVDPVVVLRSE